MTKKIKVKIRGLSGLLMHAYPLLPIEAIEKKTPEEQAELAVYRNPKTKELFIPGIALQRALVSGAVFSKGKGRSSLQKTVAACVLVSPEYIGLGVSKYEVDARPVVVPATKGRIMRFRPRLDEWQVTFEIEYDADLLTEIQIRKIVDDTGSRGGGLDFRPERKGPFGRFIVTSWSA